MSDIKYQNINLGIVTPMANEADNAERFVEVVLQTCEEFNFNRIEMYLVFDYSCTDGTMNTLKRKALHDSRIKIIWAQENKCVAGAYMEGYKSALSCKNDWILEIDAGFSHDPKQIPLFFLEMIKGYDCVFGVRFGLFGSKFSGSMKRKFISRIGSFATNTLLKTRLSDMTSGFELFSKNSLEYILNKGILSNGPFFQTEIKVHAHNLNFSQVPICYCSPSHTIKSKILSESISNLWKLYLKNKGQDDLNRS